MTDIPVEQPDETREPQEEEILRLMHAQDRQIYASPDVAEAQKQAIFDFHRSRWKEANSPISVSDKEDKGDETERANLLRIDPRRIDAEYKHFPRLASGHHAS